MHEQHGFIALHSTVFACLRVPMIGTQHLKIEKWLVSHFSSLTRHSTKWVVHFFVTKLSATRSETMNYVLFIACLSGRQQFCSSNGMDSQTNATVTLKYRKVRAMAPYYFLSTSVVFQKS